MLIIQIALGIVLAVVLLAFLPYMIGLAVLAIIGIFLFAFWETIGSILGSLILLAVICTLGLGVIFGVGAIVGFLASKIPSLRKFQRGLMGASYKPEIHDELKWVNEDHKHRYEVLKFYAQTGAFLSFILYIPIAIACFLIMRPL
jgi:uncharacterized membrane protein YedE/YeeE